MGSGKQLRIAQRFIGKENFKKEVLAFCNSTEELIKLEKIFVDKQLLSDPMCYNMMLGGGKPPNYKKVLIKSYFYGIRKVKSKGSI